MKLSLKNIIKEARSHQEQFENEFKKRADENGKLVVPGWGELYFDKSGNLHRDDGPAIITDNGKSWYFHGKLHNINGPAVITHNNDKIYYLNGKYIDENVFQIFQMFLSMYGEESWEKAFKATLMKVREL